MRFAYLLAAVLIAGFVAIASAGPCPNGRCRVVRTAPKATVKAPARKSMGKYDVHGKGYNHGKKG